MSFKIVTKTLASAVATSGTFTMAYPAGTGQGSFFLSAGHQLSCSMGTFVAPADFTCAFGASEITVTWRHAATLAAGVVVSLQLDLPGADSFLPVIDAANVSGVALKLVDLGTPLTADPDALIDAATGAELPDGSAATFIDYAFPAVSASPQDGANLTGVMDVPRNMKITVGHATAVVATTVTVTGKDVFGVVMAEALAVTGGTTSKTATGVKAFAEVTNIRIGGTTGTDDIQTNTVDVGFNVVLGLPLYLASAAQILGEFEDGVAATAGVVAAGVSTLAVMSATTADVRGTYNPNSAPNSDRGYALLVADINPGYRGPAQFAG